MAELALLDKLLEMRKTMRVDAVVEHALCNSVQNIISAIVDIAQHIVSERTSGVPDSYAEAIERLGELGVLEERFASELARAAKLRNVVVHAYENLKMELVWDSASRLQKDATKFLRATDAL